MSQPYEFSQDFHPNLRQLEVLHLAFVSRLSWFLWDWLLTLPSEINVIWKRPITLGSSLYVANTLACVAAMIVRIPLNLWVDVPVKLCAIIFEAIAVLQQVQIFILQCVLALRTYAVYNCRKVVLVPLLVLNTTSVVFGVIENIQPLEHSKHWRNRLPVPYNGCSLPHPRIPWLPCVLLLTFEVAVGALMSARLLYLLRVEGYSLAQVEYIVYRDGLVESAVMSVGTTVLLIYDLVYPTGNSASFRPMWGFVPLIGTIACKRMLLNLRSITQCEIGSIIGDQKHVDPTDAHNTQDNFSDIAEDPWDEFCSPQIDDLERSTAQSIPLRGGKCDESECVILDTNLPHTY
ncbi:hypothetical protein DL93DRAFT_602334 [Clavulina sp. PMI_390]|nr:hypothetical protein DL93DRAFT_602334 [Clavulina sp. PMI_390]